MLGRNSQLILLSTLLLLFEQGSSYQAADHSLAQYKQKEDIKAFVRRVDELMCQGKKERENQGLLGGIVSWNGSDYEFQLVNLVRF